MSDKGEVCACEDRHARVGAGRGGPQAGQGLARHPGHGRRHGEAHQGQAADQVHASSSFSGDLEGQGIYERSRSSRAGLPRSSPTARAARSSRSGSLDTDNVPPHRGQRAGQPRAHHVSSGSQAGIQNREMPLARSSSLHKVGTRCCLGHPTRRRQASLVGNRVVGCSRM